MDLCNARRSYVAHKIWPTLRLLTVRIPHDEENVAGEETMEDAPDTLQSLRLSIGQPFEYGVW